MRIIISPAKKMVVDQDSFSPSSQPRYLNQATEILQSLKHLSYDQAQKLWKTSDKLTQTSYEQLQALDLAQPLSPAIFSYSGIQYQYMAPDVLSQAALEHLQETVRILSGLYGVVRPFDGIVPYRLEMGARLPVNGAKNLYAFWGDRLYRTLCGHGPIINLASNEYSKAITPYLKPADQMVDVIFAHVLDGKLKTRATPAKMARGEMVRFIAKNQLTTLEELTHFQSPTYTYDMTRSTNNRLVFVHEF